MLSETILRRANARAHDILCSGNHVHLWFQDDIPKEFLPFQEVKKTGFCILVPRNMYAEFTKHFHLEQNEIKGETLVISLETSCLVIFNAE